MGKKKALITKATQRVIKRRAKKIEKATVNHAHRFIVRRFARLEFVRQHIFAWGVIVGIVFIAFLIQTRLSQTQLLVDAPAKGGVYVEGVVGRIDTLNPLFASSMAEKSVRSLVFSSLYDYDAAGMLRNDVAQGLSVDKTGKVYTVTVRSDVRWHDGVALTAYDIERTIALIKDPRVRSPLYSTWRDVDVKASSNTVLVFTLPAKYAAFQHALTFPIIPKHKFESIEPSAVRESRFGNAPVGSGPFKFSLVQAREGSPRDKTVQLDNYVEYHRGEPLLSGFELRTYDTQEQIKSAVEEGVVNGAVGIKDTEEGVDFSTYSKSSATKNSGVYALFNVKNAILGDKKVRKALQAAIDTGKVRQSIQGTVTPLHTPVLSTHVTNLPDAPKVSMDTAAKLLDEAGWKLSGGVRTKDERPLELTITTLKHPQYKAAASSISAQLQQLGVKATTVVIDPLQPGVNFVQNTLQARNFDILVYELSIGGDADVFAYWHSSQKSLGGYNFANYGSPFADTALASARDTLDAKVRNAKYVAFTTQWLDDAPAIGLYQPKMTYIHTKKVSIFDADSTFTTDVDRFSDVTTWSVETQKVYKTP